MYFYTHVRSPQKNYIIDSSILLKQLLFNRVSLSAMLYIYKNVNTLYKYSGPMRCAQLRSVRFDYQKATQTTKQRAKEKDKKIYIWTNGKTDTLIIVVQLHKQSFLLFVYKNAPPPL